jgi:hypothetical protein
LEEPVSALIPDIHMNNLNKTINESLADFGQENISINVQNSKEGGE